MSFETVINRRDTRNLFIKFLDKFFCSLLFKHRFNEGITFYTKTDEIIYYKRCEYCGMEFRQS